MAELNEYMGAVGALSSRIQADSGVTDNSKMLISGYGRYLSNQQRQPGTIQVAGFDEWLRAAPYNPTDKAAAKTLMDNDPQVQNVAGKIMGGRPSFKVDNPGGGGGGGIGGFFSGIGQFIKDNPIAAIVSAVVMGIGYMYGGMAESMQGVLTTLAVAALAFVAASALGADGGKGAFTGLGNKVKGMFGFGRNEPALPDPGVELPDPVPAAGMASAPTPAQAMARSNNPALRDPDIKRLNGTTPYLVDVEMGAGNDVIIIRKDLTREAILVTSVSEGTFDPANRTVTLNKVTRNVKGPDGLNFTDPTTSIPPRTVDVSIKDGTLDARALEVEMGKIPSTADLYLYRLRSNGLIPPADAGAERKAAPVPMAAPSPATSLRR